MVTNQLVILDDGQPRTWESWLTWITSWLCIRGAGCVTSGLPVETDGNGGSKLGIMAHPAVPELGIHNFRKAQL